MKKILFMLVVLLQFSVAAWADNFIVRNIRFDGLQRIPASTAENYLPIRRGQELTNVKTGAVMQSLYKTGFFDDISLSRDGGTLVIHVVERPTIGKLDIKGNSVIPTDKLTAVMKSLEITEGRVYNAAILEKIKQSLVNQYYMLGRYNARVDIYTSPMPRNRVQVTINISEGLVATVKRITIIGNHEFSEDKLASQMDLSTSGLFTIVTQSDRYSEEKLETSLDKLRGYYLDRGYLHFQIKSAQAQVTPDRKSVYVTVVVDEGKPYTIESYQLEGKLLLDRAEVEKRIEVKPGDLFSRKKITDTEKALTKYYGENGYYTANVSIRPNVNENTRKVKLVFMVNPGKRTYVRYVTFTDNNRTNDDVLRREVQQFEAAPISTTQLDLSKQRLSLLPWLKEVEMDVKPVPGKPQLVDVNYKVKEDSSAQASVKVGYSQIYRVIIGAGINQKNFMGTGNTLGVNFQRSKYEQFYGIDYTDPYYTMDGISRSISASFSKTDPAAASSVNNGYTFNNYSVGVLYGIPVGQEQGVFNRIMAGISASSSLVTLIPGNVSNQVNTFVTRNGRRFDEVDFKLGYSRDSRDRAIMPTRGMLQSVFVDLFAPYTSSGVSFYTFNYQGRWYIPLSEEFIILTKGDFGYGNGLHGLQYFPFFKNYYAGGIDSVRGYLGFSLGPQDSKGLAYGGNLFGDASLALIFPNYLTDSLRTSVFFDAGNTYSTMNNRSYGGQSTNSGPIRASFGLEADWLTPLGPIELSLAKTINSRPGDKLEAFQFSLGANF